MSFENLLRILPEGLVSKNNIAPRSIEENMALWRLMEDVMQLLINMTDRSIVTNMQAMMRHPYMTREWYVSTLVLSTTRGGSGLWLRFAASLSLTECW
jgi:hypothetical protein